MKKNGQVLVHVIVMIGIFMVIATVILRWSFLTRNIQAKSMRKTKALGGLEALRSQVWACLHNTGYPANTCKPTGAQKACLPVSFNGDPVKVKLGGKLPNCDVKIMIKQK